MNIEAHDITNGEIVHAAQYALVMLIVRSDLGVTSQLADVVHDTGVVIGGVQMILLVAIPDVDVVPQDSVVGSVSPDGHMKISVWSLVFVGEAEGMHELVLHCDHIQAVSGQLQVDSCWSPGLFPKRTVATRLD